MRVEVLISTMHQNDHSLLDKMNISTEAIVVNQCEENKIECFAHRGRKVKFISLNERGVGLSRNTALMRAQNEICLFADDDVVYVDNYEELILDAFKSNPKAGMIVFNVPSTNKYRPSHITNRVKKLFLFNSLKYGTFCIAVRRELIFASSISFSLLFGGGAKFSAGEDSLFIADCIKNKIGVYTSPHVIGEVNHQESTWFKGYNEKYFIDKGAFFYCLSKRLKKILCLQFLIRHRDIIPKDIGLYNSYKLMKKGFEAIKY
jgi:glycosyltransferase involved in cell wall biosynthesis